MPPDDLFCTVPLRNENSTVNNGRSAVVARSPTFVECWQSTLNILHIFQQPWRAGGSDDPCHRQGNCRPKRAGSSSVSCTWRRRAGRTQPEALTCIVTTPVHYEGLFFMFVEMGFNLISENHRILALKLLDTPLAQSASFCQ